MLLWWEREAMEVMELIHSYDACICVRGRIGQSDGGMQGVSKVGCDFDLKFVGLG
jgi:hypothetical protein